MQLFDQKGEFLGDKKPLVPVNKMKIRDLEHSNVIDLHIHKRINETTGQVDYYLFLVASNGVLLYQSIEKKEDFKLLKDEWADIAALTPNCTDLSSQGVLLVDAAMKAQGKEGGEAAYTLRRYNMKGHA